MEVIAVFYKMCPRSDSTIPTPRSKMNKQAHHKGEIFAKKIEKVLSFEF